MMKQPYANTFRGDQHHQIYACDKDRFEHRTTAYNKVRSPSITTMFLLQIQAYIIQLLTQLPSKSRFTSTTLQKSPSRLSLLYHMEQKRAQMILSIQFISFQCLHWFLLILLFLLDNVARFLNVEHEMAEITADHERSRIKEAPYYKEEEEKTYREDYFIDQQSKQKIDFVSGVSEPASPTKVSPTPNFVRPRKSSNNTEELLLLPRGHVRSLSNNMVDQRKPISPQKLRRITAQREITVQNAATKKHHKKPPTASIVSHSSSGSSTTTKETDRPRIQKTMSLSTAQQYQKQHEVKKDKLFKENKSKNQFEKCKLRASSDQKISKPFERCCSACAHT